MPELVMLDEDENRIELDSLALSRGVCTLGE